MKQKTQTKNPLLSEWHTPFGVPPFDIIKSADYLPAIRVGIKEHNTEIEAIVNNKKVPNFKNTIEALELSGTTLNKITRVFYAVRGANTDDTLNETGKTLAPELSKHWDNINLNPKLFKRVDAVYKQKEKLNLSAEEMRLLEETYKGFIRAGVNLSAEKQTQLRKLNSRLAVLSQKFGDNLLKETNNFELYVTNPKDLGNASQSLRAVAAKEAKKRGHKEGWSFTLQRPSINPFLQASPNRALRKKIFDGYAMRGNNDNANDNKAVLEEMASIRVKLAHLKGYKTHAAYILSDNMAETPQAVYDFMDKLWEPALNRAKRERNALAKMMKKEGVKGTFDASDWRHYVGKLRKEKYNFDEEETRPYFEFTAVRQGVFMLANKLFGLTFKPLNNVPKWHKDQQVFEVLEADGSHLGVIYMDFFARESKRGGAWMNALRSQSNVNKMVYPIVTTNFNFPPPTKDTPSLLSFTEAQTCFHEFGHALHGLFSKVKYQSLSGTNVPRDFVEFPSQVMENWMSEPDVLKLYAKHYKTGKVIPEEMIKRMNDANDFNEGFRTVEYMAAAYLDMAWHTLQDTTLQKSNAFEKKEMNRLRLIKEIIPRYRSPYFAHIFSGGYSAGYYSYLWSAVLDADAFQAFKETGNVFDQATAKKYRHMLSQGGTKKGMDLYKEFRGRAPKIDALIKKRGLK
ncbi:MAG: M3 family metallopeptidase [Flavobacteriaceae bacterium]